MGCWDEACCLSNNPVCVGDPAVMVVIEPTVPRRLIICHTFA